MGADNEFRDWVRSALRHLYDFPALEKHPLAEALSRAESSLVNRAQLLRHTLLDAIRSLRPDRSIPQQSSDWRSYRILELRYIEGLSTADAMRRIGLQKSQFYDNHSRALDALADKLWEQCYGGSQRDSDSQQEEEHTELVRSEVARIGPRDNVRVLEVDQFLTELGRVIEPLARSKGARLQISCPPPLRLYAVNRVLLRQSILQVVNYGLGLQSNGDLAIIGFLGEHKRGIAIQIGLAKEVSRPRVEAKRSEARLRVCHDLLSDMGGKLQITSSDRIWRASLEWGATAQPMLLVIDDNQGFIDLFERYLADHDWHIVGAASGNKARSVLEELQPTVIILDVLMPEEDGWELLVSLKVDEATAHIPVIVCSVLGDSETALALGAVAYLPKPVTDQSLLRTLAPWMSPSATPEQERAGLPPEHG